ncbi:MAG: selenocysteine synthase, partial [Chitinophagaceae bacterium]
SYIKRDHQKDWQTWEKRINLINSSINSIKGVKTEIIIPPVANHNPSLQISWDPTIIKLTRDQMGEKLRKGIPSIETIAWESENGIRITVFMLKDGQDKIVANRIKEELMKAS